MEGLEVEEPEQPVAVGTIEEVPVIEYSDYFPISPYQEESDSFQFDPYDNIVNTEYFDDDEPTKTEPEIHCDLSILLSGISCTFNILDNEPSPEAPFEIIEETEEEITDDNNLENFSFF